MNATQAKLLWAGAMIVVAWLFGEKQAATAATGDVELGVPTVNGVYGNDVYYSARGTVPADSNPAVNPDMRRLIDQSNAAISAAGD